MHMARKIIYIYIYIYIYIHIYSSPLHGMHGSMCSCAVQSPR